MSQSQMSPTEQILQDIIKTTDTARDKIETRSRRAVDIAAQFRDINAGIHDAASIPDERRRNERVRILESSLEQLRSDHQAEERDLAAAVWGLQSYLEGMGSEYAKLAESNADEKALVARAEDHLRAANNSLQKAEAAWFFRAARISNARIQIATAEQGLKDAQAEAKRRQKARLLSANMDASLQEIQVRASKTVVIMKKRREDTKVQVAAVRAAKERLQDEMQAASKGVEKFDSLIVAKENELRQAEEKLGLLENGSKEHAEQNKLVSRMRSELEDLLGGRNTALTKHQSADKFAQELEVHERAQIRLRDNLLMWITALESDTESRVVTFKSRLEAMKTSSDQEAAKQIDDIGTEMDQRNAASMAAIGAASDRARVERFKKAPGRIRDIVDIAVTQVEARAKIEAEMEGFLAEWRERYGIDPMSTSYFTHEDPAEKASDESNS
jgi:hypothetical protein